MTVSNRESAVGELFNRGVTHRKKFNKLLNERREKVKRLLIAWQPCRSLDSRMCVITALNFGVELGGTSDCTVFRQEMLKILIDDLCDETHRKIIVWLPYIQPPDKSQSVTVLNPGADVGETSDCDVICEALPKRELRAPRVKTFDTFGCRQNRRTLKKSLVLTIYHLDSNRSETLPKTSPYIIRHGSCEETPNKMAVWHPHRQTSGLKLMITSWNRVTDIRHALDSRAFLENSLSGVVRKTRDEAYTMTVARQPHRQIPGIFLVLTVLNLGVDIGQISDYFAPRGSISTLALWQDRGRLASRNHVESMFDDWDGLRTEVDGQVTHPMVNDSYWKYSKNFLSWMTDAARGRQQFSVLNLGADFGQTSDYFIPRGNISTLALWQDRGHLAWRNHVESMFDDWDGLRTEVDGQMTHPMVNGSYWKKSKNFLSLMTDAARGRQRLFMSGQMLINWFVSAFSDEHYLKLLLTSQDLRILAAQFCTHLLAAGVLRQLPDKDVVLEALFRPDLMYYWAHTEIPTAIPQTPGRLPTVAWPPPSPLGLPGDDTGYTSARPGARYTEAEPLGSESLPPSAPSTPLAGSVDKTVRKLEGEEFQQVVMGLKREHRDNLNRLSRSQEVALFTMRGETAQKLCETEERVLQLEATILSLRQELERNQTIADIQSLTAKTKADFDSPTTEKPISFPEEAKLDANSKTCSKDIIVKTEVLYGELETVKPLEDIETTESRRLMCDKCTDTETESVRSMCDKCTDTETTESSRSMCDKCTDTETTESSRSMCDKCTDTDDLPVVARESPAELALPSTTELSPQLPPLPSMPGDGSPQTGVTDLQPPVPAIGPPPPPPMPEPEPPLPGMGPPPPPPMSGMGPPPPPMPEMGPPPPPMPGMGPPPPSMPGMGPPPPPMPGMGPPPPPMPGMGPPPPPMPGMGPPPPPMPGMGPLPPPPMPGMGPPPPPPPPGMGPPPPPPGPGTSGPMPFPAPPVGGWMANRAMLRKQPLNPVVPMKPLYWTRIIVPATIPPPAPVEVAAIEVPSSPSASSPSSSSSKVPLWLKLEEEKIEDMTEFSTLFSRQVIERKPTKKKEEKPSKQQAAKILDSKRSQNVGILSSSLHIDFSEIENAIYHFDTSVVNIEALQQIYDVRATDEEMSKIRAHLDNKPDVPLDKPEQFLHELAEIPNFADRIACFMFQSEFDDGISSIESKLNNIKCTCEFLTTSESLKTVLAIILALGNYMNGGNRTRGQADGFGLEILAKLRDVKSKDSSVTLLHFIVRTYMKKCEDPLSPELALPVPEPGDIDRSSIVNFEDLDTDLQKLQKELSVCDRKTEKVLAASSEDNLQPFKDKMEAFLGNAKKRLTGEIENLEECKLKFKATMDFYQFHPKGGTKDDEVTPKDFFPLWSPFCCDFKDIWKKEQQRIIKEKTQEAKRIREKKVDVKKSRKSEGGLKSKVQMRVRKSMSARNE